MCLVPSTIRESSSVYCITGSCTICNKRIMVRQLLHITRGTSSENHRQSTVSPEEYQMYPVPSAIRESSSVNCYISPKEHQMCPLPSTIRESSPVKCITRGTPVSCTICNKRIIVSQMYPRGTSNVSCTICNKRIIVSHLYHQRNIKCVLYHLQ